MKQGLQRRQGQQCQLEALEPRILLSADAVGSIAIGLSLGDVPGRNQVGTAEEIIATSEDTFSAETTLTYDASAQVDDIFGGTSDDSDGSENQAGTPATSPEAPSRSESQTDATVALQPESYPSVDAPLAASVGNGTSPDISNPSPEQQVTTLTAANGPPVADLGVLATNRKQVVYIELNGASNVQYQGPITLRGLAVPAFNPPSSFADAREKIVSSLLDVLAQKYGGSGAVFTVTRPTDFTQYSTVYVGGDGAAFSDYGYFYGLSEKVDLKNQDHADSAFVFSGNLPLIAGTASEYGAALADYVGHEVGHLLGYEHAHTGGKGVLAEVAFDPKVHVEIGNDARADAIDDGSVTIDGHAYPVHPRLVRALTDYPQFYNAGSVGPDGFPDVLMGQFAIHPLDHATWLTRILDMAWAAQNDTSFSNAEQLQILAWSYGFLTHSAGDHWAHTLVNEFAEGVAPGFVPAAQDQRDLGNMLRHFMTEAYIADALEGVDRNPDRTQLPDGDFSDNSTPEIEYAAPIRFIYETLIRPFPDDPTPIVEMSWKSGTLTAVAATNSFLRSEGSFNDDGFVVGNKITASGFSRPANNNSFLVASISADGKQMFVDGPLADDPADGDETIVVHVPKTALTTIGVDVTDPNNNAFTRTGGSFLADGFVKDQRFSIFGFNTNHGDFIVKDVTATRLVVIGHLDAGDATGSGDERLIVYGQRGPAVDLLFKLRDALFKQAVSLGLPGAPGEFGQLVANLIDKLVQGQSVDAALKNDLFRAYLYNWVAEIDEGVRHWADVGLAFTKAMFDPQSRRDLQNKVGAATGQSDSSDPTTLRSKAEDGVGVLDVFIEELDNPDGDIHTNDSFINQHLLPMAGLPAELGLLRSALQEFGDLIQPILTSLKILVNPIKEAVDNLKDYAKNWVKEQIKNRFGFDFEVFDYLRDLSSKMDLKEIKIGPLDVPIFKPGDHEKLDALLGLTGNHHDAPPMGFDDFPGVTFYPNADGALKSDAHLNKSTFAAYANSVTLTKMMYLMESPPGDAVAGVGAAAGQLSALYTNLLTDHGTPTAYNASRLNLHGAHGGNVMTSTLPGVGGTAPWLVSIDADSVWRQDSRTVTTTLFRVSYNDNNPSPAVYEMSGLTPGQYKVYATWQSNVTQRVDNLTNSSLPNTKISPAENAEYRLFDAGVGGSGSLATVAKNQREYADEFEDGGLGFDLLGQYTIASDTLRVQLSNISVPPQNVVAGPVLLVRVSDGATIRIQNDRNPQTLIPIAGSGYSDDRDYWTDLVYPTGGGNYPLWESTLLRPVFSDLFTDWRNGSLQFPALGDETSPDPNTIVIGKTELPSHATPFGPIIPDNKVEIPIPVSLQNVIKNGLNQVIQLVGTIQMSPPLNIRLPGLGKSLGELVDPAGAIDDTVRQPVFHYFETDSTPTFGELFDTVKASIGAGLDSIEGLLEFQVDWANYINVRNLELKVAEKNKQEKYGFELDGTIDVNAVIRFVDAVNEHLPKLAFGVNLATNNALTLGDRFYVRADRLQLAASIAATNVNLDARLGFLGVEVKNGTVNLNAALEVTFHDPNNDGRITLKEITDTNISSLISLGTPSGSFNATLPVHVTATLAGTVAVKVGDVLASAPDVFNPNTYSITFDGTFDNLLRFNHIDAGGIVGALGQLTYWLDRFRRSDLVSTLKLPLIGPALDDALKMADAFRDLVLIDDNDTDPDNNKTLLNDLNTALANAGLGRKIFAARVDVGGDAHIAFVALDSRISTFTVTGAEELNFGGTQTGNVPSAKWFAEAVANARFANPHDSSDSHNKGKVGADVAFTITIGSNVYEVEVPTATTDDNEAIGDDRWKLVNANNAPTFATAQQMTFRLLDAFGIGYPGLRYDGATDSLVFTLDLSQVFANLNLPFNFDLDDLPAFLQLQTSGELAVKAAGGLNLEVGVFLGNAEPSDKLRLDTSLADLNQPLVLDDNQRYTAQPIVGKLTADAHFSIAVNDGAPVPVTVFKMETLLNTTLANLITDINLAINMTALNGKVLAQPVPTRPGQLAPQQIQFAALGTTTTKIALTANASDTAVTELGLPTSKTVTATTAAPVAVVPAARTVASLKGRLTANAGFTVTLTNGTAIDFPVLLTPAQTADNDYPFAIVSDLAAQLSTARIEVSFSGGGALTFTTTDGSAIAIQNVTGTATNELGIVAGAGNSDDLLITVRKGGPYRVAFDSGDTELADIIDAIESATLVAGQPQVTVEINADGSGLTLRDESFDDQLPGTGTFKIEVLNNSTAGLLLGIIRPDSSGDEADPADGMIEGAEIAALTALDRFFIKATPESTDPLASVTLEIGTPTPLTAAARFGFVGLGLQGVGGRAGPGVTPQNNTLQAALTLRLLEPAGSTDGRVSLAEMLKALDDFDSLFDLSLTGNGLLNLSLTPTTVTTLNNLGIDLGGNPRLEVSVDMTQNVFDGHLPRVSFTPIDFDELGGFGNVDFNFQSIINGLAVLVDFLDDFEELGFLNDPIPVIDVSIKDLVSIAKQFADAVTAAQNDPAGSLQVLRNKLLAAFGLPPNSPQLDLRLVNGPTPGSQILKIDTQLTVAFNKSLPLNLDLGLDPLELGGDADLLAQGSMVLDLDFGFDIRHPLDVYVFDTTGLRMTLNLAATNLNFKAAVGPLGVFVTNGTASIQGTVPSEPPNTVFVTGFQGAFGGSGLSEIGDVELSALLPRIAGELHVALPVYFPTETVKAGTVKVDGFLQFLDGELKADLTPSAVNAQDQPTSLASLFTIDLGSLSLLDQLLLGVDGVDLFLEGLQDLLDGSIGGFELPLVGDKLSRAADVIGDFRSGFIEAFRKAMESIANPGAAFAAVGFAPGTTDFSGVPGPFAPASIPQGVDPVSKLLFQLLGPGGLHVVQRQSDIVFNTNIRTETNPKNVYFDWSIHMGGVVANAGTGIGFALGIPGLGLETDGRIQLDIDWSLNFGFGINATDGFYLDIGRDGELQLSARVTTPGLGITGKLGFLQVSGTENNEADEGADAEPERGLTGLTVQFAIDILNRRDPTDQRLAFSELGRIGIEPKIAGHALVDLQLALKLNSDLIPSPGNFPSVVADFAFEWGLGTVDNPDTPQNEFSGVSLSSLRGNFLSNGLRYVGFDDIGLDLGRYFSDVIGPIIDQVQEVVEPIKPFLDFLTDPIPVISDLAGPTSLLDIAAVSGAVNPGIIKAIETIDQVVDLVSDLKGQGGTKILYVDSLLPGGALVIYQSPAAGFGAAANVGIPGFDPAKPFDPEKLNRFVKSLPQDLGPIGDLLGAAADAFSKATAKMRPGGSASRGFKLPIIDNPSQIFGLLLGQPATLIEYTMDALEVEAEFSAFFPIFGPLGVSINAEFDAQFGPFTFGYDTYGITQFASGGFRNPLLLFDGLYVSDVDADGNDVPELQLDAGLWAAAELNLGIARGGVGGGLFAEINFNLYDPDHDGKVRIKELLKSLELSPFAVFDISGKLTAELFWFVKIDLGFFEIDESGQITPPLVLLNFTYSFPRPPKLATELGDGVLQLNIGKNAAARIEGNLEDVGETIHVAQGSDSDHVKVWAPQFGVDAGSAQEYLATSRIIAFGGEGDDIIDLSGVASGVQYEIYGDAGNDTITAGTTSTGAALLIGGADEDTLRGGNGPDTLFGGTGPDHLWGGGGNDWLFGDGNHKEYLVDSVITVEVKPSDENDDLHGDAADDLLFGSGGTDTLEGGDGNDVLIGDGGEVTVLPDRRVATSRALSADPTRLELAVRDTARNGRGAKDYLHGGPKNDHLYGGFGDDELWGDEDDDVIYGELGPDTINGGDGADVLFGDAGVFLEVTIGDVTTLEPFVTNGGERDVMSGGPGDDKLLGGAGNDRMQGNGGDDWLWGGIGKDEIWGDNDDGTGLGADNIFGETDSDRLDGGEGNDYIEGGGGNDSASGGAGEDTLVAGYGSDTLDGQADGDTYRISVRGGPTTELTTAYDSGATGLDTLIVVGSPGPDTLLLRAMADYYYPTLEKLQRLIEKFYNSTIADRLAAMVQAFNDAYGPWEIAPGLIQALTNEYQQGLHAQLNAVLVANRAGHPNEPSVADLSAIVGSVLGSKAAGKLDAMQKGIAAAYAAAGVTLPNTLFSGLTAAYKRTEAGALDQIRDSIVGYYVPESLYPALLGLKLVVGDVYADSTVPAADRFSTIKARVGAAYSEGTNDFTVQREMMLGALQSAWDALPAGASELQQRNALTSAMVASYTSDPVDPNTYTNTAFVAVLNQAEEVERFNYRQMEGLIVNTLGDKDYVVLDDLLAATTINLGDGNDRVQIGQVFRSERIRDPAGELITGINAEDVFTTAEITRGWLSNGVSVATTINGGDGDDSFTVFRNVAVLNLNGGDGDDVFTVRAFALKGSSDNERARTDMKGDGGADTILYVVNAPVGIDGGDGFDTVRIVGTEFGDDFVITDSGVFGAGLNVTYVNVERLVADGAEGDDRFFIMSTGLDVVTEIDGGLGSDTFFVGGNPSRAPVAVVSNDLRGHSGIILHSVESTDANWNGLPVEGLSANVGDDEEAMILVSESGGRSLVVEGASGSALGASDTYRIRLSRAPESGQVVMVAVVPAGLSPEEEAKNYADLEIWDPEYLDPVTHVLGGWRAGRTIQFTSANWSSGIEIEFRAKQDAGYEGRRFTFINHKIGDGTTDTTFLETQIRSIKVQMEDDDRDGVIIVPTGLGNSVLEGGFHDRLDVVLTRAPSAPVVVTLTVADAAHGISLSTYSLVFEPDNANGLIWNIARPVFVSAMDDAKVEGFHLDYISFNVASLDKDETKGPFTAGQVVNVGGTNITAVAIDGKVWLQVDGDIDAPGIQIISDSKPSSFVLVPHRPLPGTVAVRLAGRELRPEEFSLTGNTITFLSDTGAAELRSGKIEVNYQYREVGYNTLEVRDQVVDIYDNDTPTVIILPADDGMIDVVEGDSSTDSYYVRLASRPEADVTIVIDSNETRTTWGANAYFEKQLLLSDADETDRLQIKLTFQPADWDVAQKVTVRAIDDDRLDGNDTQVFAPDLQTVNKIRGPLIIEGAAGAGSLSLPTPLTLPWERNIRPSDGNIVEFETSTTPTGLEFATVELVDLQPVVDEFKLEDPSFTLSKLVGKTLEMSAGPGTDVVLDPNRPDDKFDRFWLITQVQENYHGDPTKVRLTLQNPTAVDPTQSNVTAPTSESEYAIASLSVNFFADEREQVDYLFAYDSDSVADDVGALTSSDGVVMNFDPVTNKLVAETSALQRAVLLLGLDDPEELAGRQLTITVGPGTGRVYSIEAVSDVDGNTKELTLAPVSGSGTPTNRSEFRIQGSDRYGRIIGFGMGPNVIFAGRPQGGGITYGDIEVVQVELGRGNDTVRVDYTTNAEDHATRRTGDYYTLAILKTGAGNDEVTVVLANGDSTPGTDGVGAFDGSDGDGGLALDTGAGNDKVFGTDSTRSLVVFGGAGDDEIHTGSGTDIVFGDEGRVDYTNKFTVSGVEYDAVITRLGYSVLQNPKNPQVTFATNGPTYALTDAAIAGTRYAFPTTYEGLIGLSLQVISPEGHVQFYTITANTTNSITIATPWIEFPVYNASDPNDNYYYRVSAYPDDQTDGQFRQPRVIWSVNNDVGGNDHIDGGSGADTIIGGAADDEVAGDEGADTIAGDDVRFDFAPVNGSGTLTRLVAILNPVSDGVNPLAAGIDGNDILDGNADVDLIIGSLGDDTIFGSEASDILIGDAAEVFYEVDGITIHQMETVDRSRGGRDTIFGGGEDDVLVGGSNDDNLDGGADSDLIFGDNVVLVLNPGSGDAIDPRFRSLLGATIYGPQGQALVNGPFAPNIQPVPEGRAPWGDWTITLDPAAANLGNDYIAGGGGDDTVFGQWGSDVIQGDGSILGKVDGSSATLAVGAGRLNGYVWVNPSFEAATDGDDYIEGNSGADVIFGGLGQDDLIGGSSDLFSLSTAALRPDDSDYIFGGAGSEILRNEAGNIVDEGDLSHARDADMILGDNGNILRLVSLDAANKATYRTFNYDNYEPLRLVVRAAHLLDYSPGGPDFARLAGPLVPGDIGAADEIHGESGDDFIFGMAGNDVLFGEGQDDDIVGGYGSDWISGGTGDDGVIGDDGRIFTSRNGLVELLIGLVNPVAEEVISTPGGVQQAVINVSGRLQKTVDLTPFNLDPAAPVQDPLFAPRFADDIIFGGLGDDFLHGGAGDDAILGGEAVPVAYAPVYDSANGTAVGVVRTDYEHPYNPGGLLHFNPNDLDGRHTNRPQAGEFALYDENDPLRKILLNDLGMLSKQPGSGLEFFLNFNAVEGPSLAGGTIRNGSAYAAVNSDGDDRIFGDLGNDWLVGGTGRDDLFGGWGNDLINADDDLTTNSGVNDGTDTHPSYEDRAYGGAGRDYLIANTGGDRLIDWVGEMNSFLVPFAPFGLGTVSRSVQPALFDFLYKLSAGDGADMTRAADAGTETARNGEPHGELGLVTQKDEAWHDQTGGPADPQAGNLPGGRRDVLRSAAGNKRDVLLTVAFEPGAENGFFSDAGTWSVTNGRYQANPAQGHDGISLLYTGDTLADYFEVIATVNANNAKGAFQSNGYVIFDYESATNFKFAGVDVAQGKIRIGQRTPGGWVFLAEANMRLDVFADYELKVALNGTEASLAVRGNNTLNYDFGTPLNAGMIGLGTDSAVARFDDVSVLVLPQTVLSNAQVTSAAGTKRDVLQSANFDPNTPNLFVPEAGTWRIANNRYEGAPGTLNTDAVSLMTLGDLLPAYAEILSIVDANKSKAGVKSDAYIIFDYHSSTDFKYAGVDIGLNKIQIGQRTAAGWSILVQANFIMQANTDYQLKLVLNGDTATLDVNGSSPVSFTFGAPLTGGRVGVGTDNSFSRFDDVRVLVMPPPVPLSVQEAFNSGTTVPGATQDGQWNVTNGHLQGQTTSTDTAAVATWSVNVGMSLGLRVQATVNSQSFGGLVFDYQNPFNFKFAALVPGSSQLVVGHRDVTGWNIDTVIRYSVGAGIDYRLSASLRGNTASLFLDGQDILNWTYRDNLLDGYVGLFTLKGSTVFDDLSIQSFVP